MRIRKPTLSRITGNPIQKFKINLTIGKRTYKNATPFAALRYLKSKPLNEENKTLIKDFEFFHAEYRKWKSKKLRNYSKAWRTRIKRKIDELEYFADNFLRSENAGSSTPNSNHFHLMGDAFFNPLDSRWDHLWPWIVKNDFNGDDYAALEAYEKWIDLMHK